MIYDKSAYKAVLKPDIHTVELLKSISENFDSQGAQRAVSAILYKNWTDPEIDALAAYLADARAKIEKEHGWLKDFATSYNKEFSTLYNGHCQLMQAEFCRMRSNLAVLKTLAEKTSPRRTTTQAAPGKAAKNAIETSIITCGAYQPDLYGIESFPPSANRLVSELTAFFDNLNQCLRICREIIDEENSIRANAPHCAYMLGYSARDFLQRSKNLLPMFSHETAYALTTTNRPYQMSLKYDSQQAFAQQAFHKFKPQDMDLFYLIEFLMFMHGDGYTKQEILLFADNRDTIRKARLAADNFDRLLPEGIKKGDVSLYVYAYCHCVSPENIKGALEYLKTRYNGKHTIVSYSAVKGRNKQYLTDSTAATHFRHALEQLEQEAERKTQEEGQSVKYMDELPHVHLL